MPTILINLDDLADSYALYGELVHRYGHRDTGRLVDINLDINGNLEPLESDEYVEADPTPPHGTPRTPQTALDVDCPHPGCPGRVGQWCGNPTTQYSYGPHFIHQARWNAVP